MEKEDKHNTMFNGKKLKDYVRIFKVTFNNYIFEKTGKMPINDKQYKIV